MRISLRVLIFQAWKKEKKRAKFTIIKHHFAFDLSLPRASFDILLPVVSLVCLLPESYFTILCPVF